MTSSFTPHATLSPSRHERPPLNSYDDFHAQNYRWPRDLSLSETSTPSTSSPSEPSLPSSLSLSSSLPPPLPLVSPLTPNVSATLAIPPALPSLTVTVTASSGGLTPLAATVRPAAETGLSDFQVNPVCIGQGLDAQSIGLLSTLVIPSVVGIAIWLVFAILRPRYRQVYGLREWFVQQELRPKQLSRSFWAWLFPDAPLFPPLSSNMAHAGTSVTRDAYLFPSDEQLSQRVLWTCLLVLLGWSALGLAGFLPLYMVDTSCLADSIPPAMFTGAYSALQDLSLLRLLRLLDPTSISSFGAALSIREVLTSDDHAKIRTRMIIITVFAIALGVLPALVLIIREFNKLVAYRERWLEVHCQGLEMGWLSGRAAPGFVGWGERRLKDFLVKTGLSASLDPPESANGRRRRREQELLEEQRAQMEIDVRSLFSIGDTTALAVLIEERDEILERLEIAETKYISSFKLTTPEPSLMDTLIPPTPLAPDIPPPVPPKPEISRPRPLGASQHRRRRGRNPAYGSSSLPPSSFVYPSQYYKLGGINGVNGGQFTDPTASHSRSRIQSFTDSFNSRVVGSRFQEVNRDSVAFGRLPIGSQVVLEKNGQMGPASVTESPLPDSAPYGPGASHTSWDTAAFNDPPPHWWTHQPDSIQEVPEEAEFILDEDWVDVLSEAPEAVQHGDDYNPYAIPRRRRPRPPRSKPLPQTPRDDRRESFPLRHKATTAESLQPPHLRLQPRGPYFRPISGLDYENLTDIYNDINEWRGKLKAINNTIGDIQRECYNDIADGARVKGWLMVGRGLRFMPGVELIEGRAKEDIRWDELQNEGTFMRLLAFWTIVGTVGILLGIGMTAVAGLAVASAPEYAHYFPFFLPISSGNDLGAGVAICLAASFAAFLFMVVAVGFVDRSGQLITSVSLSTCRFMVFKAIFYALLLVGTVWLFTVGAVLFAFGAFSMDTNESLTVANGAIYMSAFAMAVILTIAIIVPAFLLLQPSRLWHVLRDEKAAITPRQRFRAVYPGTYNPSYATAACTVAMMLASAFSLIFPLVAPAAVLAVLLTLIEAAHRFLIGYVYGRTQSQTGGLLWIWLMKRLGTILAFQPLLLGLILLTRRLWIEGGVLCGAASFVFVFVEFYWTR
ncbi:hypothetical protein NM688_g1642 [Phlebia brevispora]|uniref:Uncharacterized protein n=1 Tax=Phlebia brevispora TaxID=194682 RepID=A0ACC1TAQ2_9APHY|nr:hypothetical protein NM688_g1642 [Phlebia brevispora]